MKRLFATVLFLASCLMTQRSDAIMVVAASNVLAMNCCSVGTVRIFNDLTISGSSSFWANETFSHLWLATAQSCDYTYNGFAEICCITASGNYDIVATMIQTSCPIAARGRSYGWIGGYGNYPYHEDQADSLCEMPCYCGGGGGGEDPPCDPEDPFCF